MTEKRIVEIGRDAVKEGEGEGVEVVREDGC